MATGLIGTSRIIATGNQSVLGTTLTYTCPSSGVSYAVVSINAGVSIETQTTSDTAYARAGTLTLRTRYNSFVVQSESLSYSVVLGPGQTWSDYAEAITEIGNRATGYAFLQASVLEVV